MEKTPELLINVNVQHGIRLSMTLSGPQTRPLAWDCGSETHLYHNYYFDLKSDPEGKKRRMYQKTAMNFFFSPTTEVV